MDENRKKDKEYKETDRETGTERMQIPNALFTVPQGFEIVL